MKPGTVVIADFPGVQNTKRRPAVVVSSEQYAKERPDVILAVVTSQIHKANASTDHVIRDWSAAGLAKPSAIRMFLFTLPKNQTIEIGELSDFDCDEMVKRVRIALQ